MLVHFNHFKDFPHIQQVIADNQTAREAVAALDQLDADCVVKQFDPELLEYIESLDVPVAVMEDNIDLGYAVANGTESGVLLYVSPARISTRSAICTIKHELVHAKQYTDGRLRIEGGSIYWLGQQYVPVPIPMYSPITYKGRLQFILEFLEYYNQPWEAEANADIWDLLPDDPLFRIGAMLLKKHGCVWSPDIQADLGKLSEEEAKAVFNNWGQ